MTGIVFWFESFDKDVFSSRPTVDLDAWRYAAHVGAVSSMRVFNTSFLPLNGGISDFQEVGTTIEDFDNWMAENATVNTVVFVTPWMAPAGAIPMISVDHSTVDWYVFGSSDGVKTDYPNVKYVYLPQFSRTAMHSVHIASAAMLRRAEALT